MRLVLGFPLLVPVALGLAGCGSPPPQTVIVQPASATVSPIAPMAPPAPKTEVVSSPPASAAPTVWQQGHWRYTGIASAPWNWVNGQYVAVPSGATAWVPGQWQHQGGGWIWQEGHWAS